MKYNVFISNVNDSNRCARHVSAAGRCLRINNGTPFNSIYNNNVFHVKDSRFRDTLCRGQEIENPSQLPPSALVVSFKNEIITESHVLFYQKRF